MDEKLKERDYGKQNPETAMVKSRGHEQMPA
jgi:hypothetical protein